MRKTHKVDDEMLPEYDFSAKKGIRRKYADRFRAGYAVRIYDGDKLVSNEYFAQIEADVHEYFPDSKSVKIRLCES